eukprot:2679064-Rhodomonas_salina.2
MRTVLGRLPRSLAPSLPHLPLRHSPPAQALTAFALARAQEKKRLVFESTVGGSNEALARLTEGDMRFLFT